VVPSPRPLAELLAPPPTLPPTPPPSPHSRVSGSLALGEVEVALRLETRGPRHQLEVLESLRASGHQVISG
ncbi:MAG: threonine ammonia-lyase, partial [Pseudonocardia sp.]